MDSLIPVLSMILPVIAVSLLIIVISVNLYIKIRRKFLISVNCWFCNSWTKVAYDNRNSFDCPTCSQYNGFTRDGGYNKIIPEQHDELMNKSTQMKTTAPATNGLCALCNNNQRLKIFQLANFVPLVEENYDVEIEHFQKQLEKAYKLCKKCDRVLKRTIDKQNAWIFGNRVKTMCSNGFSKIADQIKKETKGSVVAKLGGCMSVIFVLAVILTTTSSVKIVTKTLSTYIPATYLSAYKSIISGVNASKIIDVNWPPYITKSIKVESYAMICGLGLSFHTLKMIWSQVYTATKVNHLLCWIILFLISWIRSSKNFSTYILFTEAFCCIYLLSTAFTKDEDKKQTENITGKSMRKLVKNLEYTCTDYSDMSDFENISSSSKNYSGSSDYLNKSTCFNLDAPLLHNHTLNTAGNVLNSSFVTAKSNLMNCDMDLNKSLNNLNLGGLGFKPPKASSVLSFTVKRPKPVLSPPKFQNVNSWVAGGFWKDADGVVLPLAQRTNLSRSSSESSGFGSQHNENVQFLPPKNNYFGDFDKLSTNSEFSRLSPSLTFPFSTEFKRNTTIYPNVQPNNMPICRVGSPGLFKFNNESYHRGSIENWSDKINSQATQNFKDLSLHS